MGRKKKPASRSGRYARGQLGISICLTVVVVCVFIAGFQAGWFRQADHFFYDFHFRLRGPLPVSGHILLVLMDDHSADVLGKQKGDWSRRQTALALENLCQAGAEIIGLDLVMSEPAPNSRFDTLLADTMARCNNVVLPRVAATQHGGSRTPLALFASAMIGEGFIDAQLDDDGVWRRMNYFNAAPLPDGTMQVIPSFPLELVRTYLFMDYRFGSPDTPQICLIKPDADPICLPRPDFFINYHGDIAVFDHMSYSDVVLGQFDPDRVRGKLVIIGSTLAVNKDKFFTPFSRFHSTPEQFKDQFKTLAHHGYSQKDFGISCLANAAESILNDRMITVVPFSGIAVLLVLLGVMSLVFHDPGTRLFPGFLLLGATICLVILVRHWAFVRADTVFNTAPLLGMILVQFVLGTCVQKVYANRKAARISAMFGRYVSKSVASELVKDDIDAHMQASQQTLTILFSDLRDFTAISEGLDPKDTRQLLNAYFGAMIPLVFRHGGTLDKLVGDMVMAFFGAPLPMPDHPVRAVETALAMDEALAKLRSAGSVKGLASLRAGIGINTGPVVVGNLGSDEFIDYTVIGDAVNVASRLEGLNKVYGTRIIISDSTRTSLDDRFLVRKLDRVRVKGKTRPVLIYELCGYADSANEQMRQAMACFETGIEAFWCRNFEMAQTCFETVLAQIPEDGPSMHFVRRINTLSDAPPGPQWDGIACQPDK